MISGYNTNIKYGGSVYHVQTEDKGSQSNVIETLVYQGGTIIHSLRSSYADIIDVVDLEKRVRKLVENQHKKVMKEIQSGMFGKKKTKKEKTEESEEISDTMNSSSESDPGVKGIEQTSPSISASEIKARLKAEQRKMRFDSPSEEDSDSDTLEPVEFTTESDESPKDQAGNKESKKYVSGAEIQKSSFMEKIEEQTDRIQLSKFDKEIENRNLFVKDIQVIMKDMQKRIEEILSLSIYMRNMQILLDETKDSPLEKLFYHVTKNLNILTSTVNSVDQVGTVEEILIQTSKTRLLMYCIGEGSSLIIVVKKTANLAKVRFALYPFLESLKQHIASD